MNQNKTWNRNYQTNQGNIVCPNCHKAKLREIKANEDTIGYLCVDGCKAIFDRDPDFHVDLDKRKIHIFVKMRNPEYQKQLSSADWLRNLEVCSELDKKGIPFHSKVFKIGEIDF